VTASLARKIGSALFILVVWQALVQTGNLNELFLPAPLSVLKAMWALTLSGRLPWAVVVSLNRVVQGFVYGALAGVVLGLLALFRANKRFDGYVASASGSQEHVVHEGWGIDLVFIDRVHSHTPYTVVYKHLDYPRSQTYHRHTRGRNVPSVLHLQAGTTARIDVRWYVQGKSKARWTFTIRPRETSGGPAA